MARRGWATSAPARRRVERAGARAGERARGATRRGDRSSCGAIARAVPEEEAAERRPRSSPSTASTGPGADDGFEVERTGDGVFRVTGRGDRAAARRATTSRTRRRCATSRSGCGAIGVIAALEAAGFEPGDDVEIGGVVVRAGPRSRAVAAASCRHVHAASIKLGSTHRRRRRGELRADVLARSATQAAALHAAGDEVVIVTSGAIARGMRLMGLPARPRRWTSCRRRRAVGQGQLYRVYDELLAAHGVPSAQVLLTFFDIQRADALPERPPHAAQAARLARRAGDQRERHDRDRRDLVRRQRLPRGAGGDPARRRPARAADRHDGALHAPTRALRPGRRAGRAGEDFDAARGARHRPDDDRRSAPAACARRSSRPRWRRPPGSPP